MIYSKQPVRGVRRAAQALCTLCVCIYIYICIDHICVYIYIYTSIYVYISMCIYIYIYTHTYVYIVLCISFMCLFSDIHNLSAACDEQLRPRASSVSKAPTQYIKIVHFLTISQKIDSARILTSSQNSK